MVLLGFAAPTHEVSANEFIRHEQRLLGSFVYNIDQFRRAVDLAHSTAATFVTNLGWHDVLDTLTAFQDGDHTVVKAAFRPR